MDNSKSGFKERERVVSLQVMEYFIEEREKFAWRREENTFPPGRSMSAIKWRNG